MSLTSTTIHPFNSSWSCKISHPQVFVKKNYSQNQKMKNLSWSPLSIRLQACGLQLYEQRIPTKLLSCEIGEIFQYDVSSDYLWTTHLHFLWPHIWETLRVKCPNGSFFWSAFLLIWTEYVDLWSKSQYSVRIWENTDQTKLRIWSLITQWELERRLRACYSIRGAFRTLPNIYDEAFYENK